MYSVQSKSEYFVQPNNNFHAVMVRIHTMHLLFASDAACVVPEHFWGDYYSIDRGDSLETLFNKDGIENKHTTGACIDFVVTDNTSDALGRFDARILFHNR